MTAVDLTAAAAPTPRDQLVEAMKRGYSMHGDGLLANMADQILAAGWTPPVARETPQPEKRWPTGRPGWLGTGQPWPCGRCGREVDDEGPHTCVPREETP